MCETVFGNSGSTLCSPIFVMMRLSAVLRWLRKYQCHAILTHCSNEDTEGLFDHSIRIPNTQFVTVRSFLQYLLVGQKQQCLRKPSNEIYGRGRTVLHCDTIRVRQGFRLPVVHALPCLAVECGGQFRDATSTSNPDLCSGSTRKRVHPKT